MPQDLLFPDAKPAPYNPAERSPARRPRYRSDRRPPRIPLRPPKWLYAVDEGGIAVAQDFGLLLLAGDNKAMRQLFKLDLITLYTRHHRVR